MSDIKLFEITDGQVSELEGQSVAVEKSLQALIESHLGLGALKRSLQTQGW